MPPPPRPNLSTTSARLLKKMDPNAESSPYFLKPTKDVPIKAVADKRRNRSHEKALMASKGKVQPHAKGNIIRSTHKIAQKPPIASVQDLKERAAQNLQSAGLSVVDIHSINARNTEGRPCSPSDDEEERLIRLQASKEKRGFRSAKSLERSISKRRKVKG